MSRCSRSWGVLVVLFALSAGPAGAATLVVQREDTWPPGWAEPYTVHHIVYDGEGSEANNVTIAPDAARTGVVITDPGVTIKAGGPGTPVPSVDGSPYPPAMWSCTSPGTSVAACAGTPGYQCWSLGCSGIPVPVNFEGRLKVAGNAGDDQITIEPSNFRSNVWGVFGDDTIDVRNGQSDNVMCGSGHDTVNADPYDWVESTCEAVTRP